MGGRTFGGTDFAIILMICSHSSLARRPVVLVVVLRLLSHHIRLPLTSLITSKAGSHYPIGLQHHDQDDGGVRVTSIGIHHEVDNNFHLNSTTNISTPTSVEKSNFISTLFAFTLSSFTMDSHWLVTLVLLIQLVAEKDCSPLGYSGSKKPYKVRCPLLLLPLTVSMFSYASPVVLYMLPRACIDLVLCTQLMCG